MGAKKYDREAQSWRDYWAGLSDDEQQGLRDKAGWEHMTLMAVAIEWGAVSSRSRRPRGGRR